MLSLVVGGFGFGGAQRGPGLAGMTAAQFGVSGHGQLPLLAVACSQSVRSAMFAARTVAFPVGVVHGPVAVRQALLPGGLVVVAMPTAGCRFGGGPEGGQVCVAGGGAGLAEFVAGPRRRPRGLERVGIAQVQQAYRRGSVSRGVR